MLLKVFKSENEKLIFVFLGSQQDIYAHERWIQELLLASNMLIVINDLNFKKRICFVLPRDTIDRFNLDWDRKTTVVGGQQIKQGNVPCERSRNVTHTAEFGCNQMLSDLPRQLS